VGISTKFPSRNTSKAAWRTKNARIAHTSSAQVLFTSVHGARVRLSRYCNDGSVGGNGTHRQEGRAPCKNPLQDVVFLIQKPNGSVVTSDEQMIGRKMIGSHDVTVLTGSCADGAALLVRK